MADVKVQAVITAKDSASSVLKRVGKTAASVAKIGFGALAIGAGLAVREFVEAEKIGAQLNAVLKSTKGVAGLTAKEVTGLADSLSKVTTFEDDAIVSGQNMLLTFTKIGEDVFPQATETMLDMSTALGQDLQGSAIQLGKALNDPIRGVTALRRVGVTFSESQQKMIDKLVESGDLLGAQKIILKELQTEFGGSAKAARDTFGGSMIALKNNFMNAMEVIGGSIAKALQGPMEGLAKWFEENPEKVQAFADGLARAFESIVRWIGRATQFVVRNGEAFIFWGKVLVGALVLGKVVTLIGKVGLLLKGLKDIALFIKSPKMLAGWATLSIVAGVALGKILYKGNLVKDKVNQTIDRVKALGQAFTVALDGAVAYAKEGVTVAGSIASRISRGKDPIKKRASGGTASGMVTVGERGPERVFMGQRGAVVPSNRSGGNGGVSLTVNIGMFAGTPTERRKIAQTILDDLNMLATKKGTTILGLAN